MYTCTYMHIYMYSYKKLLGSLAHEYKRVYIYTYINICMYIYTSSASCWGYLPTKICHIFTDTCIYLLNKLLGSLAYERLGRPWRVHLNVFQWVTQPTHK